MQLSYAQLPRRRMNEMDLKEIFRFVTPKVREAAVKTAAQLEHLGVRYALAGGLAVGAPGYIHPHRLLLQLILRPGLDEGGQQLHAGRFLVTPVYL